MEPEIVETYVGTADKAVTDKPTRVYWLFLEVLQLGTPATLKIKDGFSTEGEEKVRIAAGYSRVHCFCPPIRCAHGLYIDVDAWVKSYSVGYREEKDIPSLK